MAKIRKYTDDELIAIAREHKEHFVTRKAWDDYARENNLPSSTMYINRFENLNTVYELIGFRKEELKMQRRFTDEELLYIIKKHKKHFTTTSHWNEYAKLHSLPYADIFIERFGWNELKKMLGLSINKKTYTTDELLSIGKAHLPHVTSKEKWDLYAKENDLPSARTFQNRFGSWNAFKKLLETK